MELLNLANQEKDPLLRIAYILAYIVSNEASFAYRCRKPFLPILGETFEIYDEKNGVRSLTELVSFHPLILAQHACNDNFEINYTVSPHPQFKGKYYELKLDDI